MRSRAALLATALSLATLSSCTEYPASPTRSALRSEGALPSLRAMIARTIDDEFAELAEQVPGFGGLALDTTGVLHVNLADMSVKPLAEGRVRDYLADRFGPSSPTAKATIEYRQAEFDYRDLLAWRRLARRAFTDRAVVGLDINEATNRIEVLVAPEGDMAATLEFIAAQGVPLAAIMGRVAPRGRLLTHQNLRHAVSPRKGGLGISRTGDPSGMPQDCTLGFNGLWNWAGPWLMVTNSHCVPPRGQVTPLSITQGGQLIGSEISDPPYFMEPIGWCPPSRYCRWSDAAVVQYNPGISVEQTIAFTGLPACTLAPCGIKIQHGLQIIINDDYPPPLMYEYVSKTGQTSGWTRGWVTATCSDQSSLEIDPVINDYPLLLCQYKVYAYADPGDSGAPVYTRYTDVAGEAGWATLHGILWGLLGGAEYVFSPLAGIWNDVGFMVVY